VLISLYLASIVMDLAFSGLFSLNAVSAFKSMAIMLSRACTHTQTADGDRGFSASFIFKRAITGRLDDVDENCFSSIIVDLDVNGYVGVCV
jgi:hypothetical protein